MDVFICGVCHTGFHDIGKFVEHKNSLGSYGCGHCQAVFHTTEEMAEHVIHDHQGTLADNETPTEVGQEMCDGDNQAEMVANLQMGGIESVTLVPVPAPTQQSALEDEAESAVTAPHGDDNVRTLMATQAEVQQTMASDPEARTIVLTDGFSFEATENSVVSDIFACSLCQCFALSEDEMLNHVSDSHNRHVVKGSEEACALYYRLQQLAPTVLTAAALEERKTLKILPVEGAEEGESSGAAVQPTTVHLVVETSTPPAAPKRRRGRPRKVDQAAKPLPPPLAKKPEEEEVTPVRGEDGMYRCSRCRKAFHKERHILGHRCMAKGDYVDNYEKKDEDEEDSASTEDVGAIAAEADGMEIGDAEVDTDSTEDFKVYRTFEREPWSRGRHRRGRGLGRGRGARGGRRVEVKRDLSSEEGGVSPAGGSNKENVAATEESAGKSEEGTQAEAVEVAGRKLHWREDPRHVPVFSTDDERLAFEEHLNRVDLSCVDHLYTQHQVAQEITSLPGSRVVPKEICDLHVFSCNVCKKVFKTQSHMRLHCLIHTDLKPFTCHQCEFSTNAKGNLYTHMRKHTGNYFKCSHCDFRSCNRSHMAEHEATHSSVRYGCELCGNDYNTTKSLVNHVRKYHTGPTGRRYLSTFQSKQLQNMAVLHVCHLCNRKFKKKVDRDRHLFVHNVPEPPTAYQCGLCGYQASRRAYLENHYRKHRLVYVCCICCGLHLSAISLRQHLQNEHLNKVPQSKKEEETSEAMSGVAGGIECFVAENTGGVGEVGAPEETVSDIKETVGDTVEEVVSMEDVDSAVAEMLQEVPSKADNMVQDNVTEEPLSHSDDKAVPAAVPPDATLETLFVDSIRNSWYLPEPDGSLVSGNYVNIPQELTESQSPQDQAAGQAPDNLQAEKATPVASLSSGPQAQSLAQFSSLLNYKQLTEDVFAKIREAFGEEECPDCGRLFHSRLDLEPHRMTHTEDKPFKCSQCSYNSGSKDNLKRHQETAHEGKTFPCDRCEFVAQSRSSLFQHRQKHAAAGPQGRCPACQSQFPSWRMLRNHLLSEHPDVDRQELFKATGGPPRVMGRMGRRTYKCPYCGRVFHRSSTDLQKHMWIHEGVKPFQCPECPYQCRSRNNLNVHRLTHSNDKPHLCEQCNKGYKSKAALRLHTRTHGRGVLYPCNKCEYTATQKCHLKRHLETHDIIRRYVCEHCSYSSNTINYMKVHYSRKHRGEVFNQNSVVADPSSIEQQKDRVYKCLSCSYIFGNMNDMKRHLRLKHGVCLENLDLSVEEVSADTLATETEVAAASADEEMALAEGQDVELVQLEGEEGATAILSPSALQGLQLTTGDDGDDGTASAVSIIQQMMEQGALDAGQQVTLQTLDGESLVAVNRETIIVREDGRELVLEGPGETSYVIQYVQEASLQEDDQVEQVTVEVAP